MLHPMISRLIGVIKAKTVVLFCKFGDHSKFRVTSYSYCQNHFTYITMKQTTNSIIIIIRT